MSTRLWVYAGNKLTILGSTEPAIWIQFKSAGEKYLGNDWTEIIPVSGIGNPLDGCIAYYDMDSSSPAESPGEAALALLACRRESAQDTLEALGRRGWKLVRA